MSNPATDSIAAGSLIAQLDPAGGVIRITGSGSWSIELLERHLIELQRLLLRARYPGRGARVLSDVRLSAVQAPKVAARIERFTAEGYGPADRIAIVVSSSLLRMQLRRVVQRARVEAFLSTDAAERWLAAHDEPSASALPNIARAPRCLTSIVTTAQLSDRRALAVRVINISTSGILIDGRGDLGVDARLRLALPSIGMVTGRIVRVRDGLAGIKLDRLIPSDQIGVIR